MKKRNDDIDVTINALFERQLPNEFDKMLNLLENSKQE